MSQSLDDGKQLLTNRCVWAEPLFKFAQVSGLVVSLYDRYGKRCCGPCFNQGFAARVARTGIWDESGWASADERRLVQRCLSEKKPLHETILGLLGQLAVPCLHKGDVSLVFVLGWVPQYAPDAATLKVLEEQLNIPQDEIHPLIRSMTPISEDQLRVHGHMLGVFSSSLLQLLALQSQNEKDKNAWRILSDTAFALAAVTTEREICQIAHRALRTLLPEGHVEIKLHPPPVDWNPAELLHAEDRVVLSMMPHVTSVRQHLSLPLRGLADQLSGQIEITLEYRADSTGYKETLQALAEQIGVALQKSRFLSGLEQQRRASKPIARKKDEFLAAVSQKLKIPLHAMMGWVQTSDQKEEDPGNQQEALQMIQRNVQHQAHLLNNLLDISRSLSAPDEKPQVLGGQPSL